MALSIIAAVCDATVVSENEPASKKVFSVTSFIFEDANELSKEL